MFNLSKATWTRLQPMINGRFGLSLVVYNNELFVVGVLCKSIEKLSLNSLQDGQSLPWENFPAELPERLSGHCSVVYDERLIVIGGYDNGKDAFPLFYLIPVDYWLPSHRPDVILVLQSLVIRS